LKLIPKLATWLWKHVYQYKNTFTFCNEFLKLENMNEVVDYYGRKFKHSYWFSNSILWFNMWWNTKYLMFMWKSSLKNYSQILTRDFWVAKIEPKFKWTTHFLHSPMHPWPHNQKCHWINKLILYFNWLEPNLSWHPNLEDIITRLEANISTTKCVLVHQMISLKFEWIH
jgi:hypothetical protein